MLMKIYRRYAATLLAALLLCVPTLAGARAAAPQAAVDTVLILPFENTSGLSEYHWVGESFADSLAELLGGHGMRVVSSDRRELAYQRLRLPLTVIPSRATAIKLAREAGATLVVLGNYEVTPARDEKSVPEARGSAKLVRVNEGRISGKEMPDGRWATHEFFFGDALVHLQTVQGTLAYQILYEQNPLLHYSRNAIIESATKVPPVAFEAYVKATLTEDREKKEAYLKNAMREFERANPGSVYKQAAFELGHLYFAQRDYKGAAEHFSMLQARDPHYAEAAFYASLSYYHTRELQSALDALLPLTQSTPLTSIFNNAGALAAQLAHAEKNAAKRDALLKQATNVLGRAVESTPEDQYARYNYAYALLLSGRYAEAAKQFGELVKANPRHPEALFLLAKSQEKAGKAEAAAEADNEARKFYVNYGKAQVEWEKSQTISMLPVQLRGSFDRGDFFDVVAEAEEKRNALVEGAGTQDLLAKARELYAAGQDDEALAELRNVVRIEPNNAEAYLLTGRIYLRRGELATAINQLRTAIFWEPKTLIDPHILLGRIFLERGDQAQARAYAQSALQIDPNHPEAIALQRQLQVGIK